MIEAIVCAAAFYLLVVHTLTAEKSFVNPRLFLDRNFAVSMVFIFVIGITYLASLALMTPYLQTLMGYPVITAGHRHGAARPRHHALHVHRRPADRQGRYAPAAGARPRR